MFFVLAILALTGFILSAYLLYVELQLKKNHTYKPFCDISDTISCTKPLGKTYSLFFGIQNSLIGMAYYGVIMLLAMGQLEFLARYITFLGLLASIYLGYILYKKVKVFCVICVATYGINLLLFIVSNL